MQKIVIFGASGGVGVHATELALKKGFKVRALLRDPLKLPENLRNNIEVIQGDVTKEDDVREAVKEQDAVVVILGTRNDLSPTTELSVGMKNIVSAMKEAGVDHVSVCLSAFLFYDLDKLPSRFRDITEEHQRMLDCLKNSNVKWIAVLPPHFTDDPSGKYKVTHDSSPGRTIAKCDLALFLLESLSNPEHYNKVCGIATVV